MKKLLTAVVVFASTAVLAGDQAKDKAQMGQTPPSPTQPSDSMGNGDAMGNGDTGMGKPAKGMDASGMKQQFSASMIQDWPAESKKAAEEIVSKYGSPQEMTASELVWKNAGPFKKTVVYKEAVDHQFPVPHKEVIEQVIDYKVPADKVDELVQFNGSLGFDRTKGELSVRSDSEANNIAILNTADGLIKNKMSVTKARDSLAKLVGGAQAGQQPEAKLQITAMTQPTEDPDRPAPGMGQ